MNHPIELLQAIPLFQGLTEAELEKLWEIVGIRHCHKKEIIFREGATKTAIYIIQSGMVKTYKTDDQGHEQIVCLLRQGDMFPHTGFFNQLPYPATAETIDQTVLISIPVEPFEQVMLSNPTMAVKVMRVMGNKILDLQKQLHEYVGHDVQQRAVTFLLDLADKYGENRDGTILINIPLTHQDFASAIGTTRETVSRLLSQLRKQGLLRMGRNQFVIPDLDALRHWVGS
ncbi:Crp/Fnr family transcriptional regulator [Laceyella tengchongensis]|uniref:Crp/Fnr family transcriptional regulator n=1 Tax=Laceyella tengchongensis TaxID=574699 RepID=UPI0012B83F59|nr:helix-turn-helix domain-containing protein [Laceyella tengchongensis]